MVRATVSAPDPMRLPNLVEAAILIGNGIWYITTLTVINTDCAARCCVDRYDAENVRMSNASLYCHG